MIKLATNKIVKDEVDLFLIIYKIVKRNKKYTISENNIKKIFQLNLLDHSEDLKREIREIIPIIKNTWFMSFYPLSGDMRCNIIKE